MQPGAKLGPSKSSRHMHIFVSLKVLREGANIMASHAGSRFHIEGTWLHEMI